MREAQEAEKQKVWEAKEAVRQAKEDEKNRVWEEKQAEKVSASALSHNGPTYVRPSRRVDTRSTYREWLLHRGVSHQVPLGLNATLTRNNPTAITLPQ